MLGLFASCAALATGSPAVDVARVQRLLQTLELATLGETCQLVVEAVQLLLSRGVLQAEQQAQRFGIEAVRVVSDTRSPWNRRRSME